jgi:hypothetical protein
VCKAGSDGLFGLGRQIGPQLKPAQTRDARQRPDVLIRQTPNGDSQRLQLLATREAYDCGIRQPPLDEVQIFQLRQRRQPLDPADERFRLPVRWGCQIDLNKARKRAHFTQVLVRNVASEEIEVSQAAELRHGTQLGHVKLSEVDAERLDGIRRKRGEKCKVRSR